jgi:hypothetical protein
VVFGAVTAACWWRGLRPREGPALHRPLGGEIEFGERAEDAARREIREEIGAEVDGLRLLGTFENLFTYMGRPGHELVWLFEGRFADPSYYDRDEIAADEGGAAFPVHWVPLDVFVRGEAPLYPEGLLEMLSRGAIMLIAMGITRLRLDVGNPVPRPLGNRRLPGRFGATYSVIPADILERLTKVTGEQGSGCGDGRAPERLQHTARRARRRRRRFSARGDATLLGAFTLEVGLILEVKRELRELPCCCRLGAT